MKNIFCITLLLLISGASIAQNNSNLFAKIENDDETVTIGWQHEDKNVTIYCLQSSTDNIIFSDIFIKKNNEIPVGESIRYMDKITAGETVYYRLKINRINKNTETTKSINNAIKDIKNSWNIYPVPAIGGLLHLKHTGTDVIDGVINILVQNIRSGTTFTRLRLASNTKNIQIPISNIGKGMYVIRVSIGNKAEWIQQFMRY